MTNEASQWWLHLVVISKINSTLAGEVLNLQGL